MKRQKTIEARFFRSLSISEIEGVAASFKEDLQREANRRIGRHDSAGGLAAIEAMEYTDKLLTQLKLLAGSRLKEALSRPPRARPIRLLRERKEGDTP